jgi:hypothetical protein
MSEVPYGELSVEEQAILRAEWSRLIAEGIESLNLAKEFAGQDAE